MDSGAGVSDRRQAVRCACTGDAEIVVPGRGLRYSGQLVNLSTGGCFVATPCRLERGTLVEVWMRVGGEPLRVAANLASRRAEGAGFRFHATSARTRERIEQLMGELAAEQARN